jgi:hypothetical protein
MTLSERLAELVQACFTGLWIQSHEHEDALREMAQLCRHEQWRLAVWDIEQGLRVNGRHPAATDPRPSEAQGADPLAALRAIGSLASADSSGLLVLTNFHRFLQSTRSFRPWPGRSPPASSSAHSW